MPETVSLNINLFDDTAEVGCGDVTLEEISLREFKFEEPRSNGIDLPPSANEDLCLVTEKEFCLPKPFSDGHFDAPSPDSVFVEKAESENNIDEQKGLETADELIPERSSPVRLEEAHNLPSEKSTSETISIKTEPNEIANETFDDLPFTQESENPPSKKLEYQKSYLREEFLVTATQPCSEESSNIPVHENSSYSQVNDLLEDTCPSNESSFICLEFEPVEIREETLAFPQESTNFHLYELIDSGKRINEEELSYIQDEDSCSSSESSFNCLEFEPIEIHEDDLQDATMQTVYSTPESEPSKVPSPSYNEETCSKVNSSDSSSLLQENAQHIFTSTLQAGHPTDDEKELEYINKPSSLQQRTESLLSPSVEDSSPSRAKRRGEFKTLLDGNFRQLRSQGQIQDNHSMSLRRRSKFSVDHNKGITPTNTRSSEKSQPRNKHVTAMQNHKSGKATQQLKSSFEATQFKRSQSNNRTMETRNDGLRSSLVYQEQEPFTKNRKTSCDICGEKMETSKQLKAHLNSAHKELAKCTICNSTFGE